MNEQYALLYKQNDEIIQFAYKELFIYVSGYRNLQNSGKATDMDLNLFRLLYCSLFSILENAVIIRENIISCDDNSTIEERYTLFTELDYLSDFYNIMNEMSGFVRDFKNVVMANYK